MSLEATCLFHRGEIAADRRGARAQRSTRSRLVKVRPGESQIAAMERYKSMAKAWLAAAAGCEDRRSHMKLADVANMDDVDNLMREAWEANGGMQESSDESRDSHSSSSSSGSSSSSSGPSVT